LIKPQTPTTPTAPVTTLSDKHADTDALFKSAHDVSADTDDEVDEQQSLHTSKQVRHGERGGERGGEASGRVYCVSPPPYCVSLCMHHIVPRSHCHVCVQWQAVEAQLGSKSYVVLETVRVTPRARTVSHSHLT
jgi:hypothetical protein